VCILRAQLRLDEPCTSSFRNILAGCHGAMSTRMVLVLLVLTSPFENESGFGQVYLRRSSPE
jgi:hypothetical protein